MAVKPIDLQTNMGHMFDVGKVEHARNAALTEQQHFLDKEADELSKNKKDKLDEADKTEKTDVREDAGKKKDEEMKNKKKVKNIDEKNESEHVRSIDDKMGNIIDVLK